MNTNNTFDIHEISPEALQGLGGGKPGRSGADNADLIRVALHIHASAILLPGLPLASPS